jgi:heat shock protein HslJ
VPQLVLEAGGRVAGSDGCNRIVGSYQLAGDAITFGQLGGTQMACLDAGDTERAFREALSTARRWRIIGDLLELYDASGRRLVRFQARAA